MPTPTRLLADTLLPEGIDTFIRTRRPALSWRKISLELMELTEGRVNVTPETVRNWATQNREAA